MSKKITYSGILLGLNIVLLLISNLISINTMFFMGLASLIISVIVMEYGVTTGVVFYIASIILSFVVMPNKSQWLLYTLTFGIYGLVTYFIEKGRPIYTEVILKLIFANLVAVILYLILKNIVIIPINIKACHRGQLHLPAKPALKRPFIRPIPIIIFSWQMATELKLFQKHLRNIWHRG